MLDNQNEINLQSWFEALNQGDVSKLDRLADQLFTPDFTWHDPRTPDPQPGPEGVKKFIQQLFADNTGIQVTVHDIFSFEDKTASRFSVAMRNIASGEPVNLQLLAIDRFTGGRIAEEWQLSAPGAWR